MALKLSRRSDIESFRALENLRAVNARVARGEDIIRLEAGQPRFGAPAQALEYAQKMIANDPIQGYTEAIGTLFLRERISQYYREKYSVEANPAHIAVTVGSSGGFILAMLAAFEAGDKIGVINPTYPAYRNIMRSIDLVPVKL